MNYTKNYHLPQWVKSDRIMMDDFNRMCADLENGLTSNKALTQQNHSTLSSRIEQVAGDARTQLQAADAASQTALKTGLLHLAYNHCHLLAGVTPQPPQLGCFFQSLRGSAAPSAASGFFERGDVLWLARGTTAYTSDNFRACFQQISQMQVVKGDPTANTPLVMRFTPPGPGCITEISMISTFNGITKRTSLFHLSLYNEHTGEYEAETDYTLDLGSGTGRSGTDVFDIHFGFSGGFSYLLEISTRDSHYYGTADFPTGGYVPFSRFTAESFASDTAGTLSRTVQCGETRTDGIVLVHCRMIGTGGTLSLNWDGASLAPSRTRDIVTIDGKAVTEMEFRRNAAIPAATSLQLNARCSAGGEITLHSWGLATI